MILALMSDPKAWQTLRDVQEESMKTSVQAAITEAAGGPLAKMGPLFWTSVIVAKQILYYAYSTFGTFGTLGSFGSFGTFDGTLMKDRITDGLNAYAFAMGLRIGNDFEDYAGSCPEVDAYGNQMTSLKSVTLWQTLNAFMIHDAMIHDKWAFESDAAADAASGASAAVPDFMSQSSYYIDVFGHLMRTTLATTGCIQRLHLNVLMKAKTKPKSFLGFSRNNGPSKTEKNVAKHATEIWRNYLFDMACIWMVVQRLANAFNSLDSNAVVHALHKAHLWTLTTGLAGSSANLMRLETHQKDSIEKVHQASLVLHWLYERLWANCMPTMSSLSAKAQGSKLAHLRSLERLAAGSFVNSHDTTLNDIPDCGTATLLDNHWSMTMLTTDQIGLVSDGAAAGAVQGHGAAASSSVVPAALLGSYESDLNHSIYIGLICGPLTQSEPHLWASVTEPKAWSNNLDRGLPSESQIERILQWQSTCSWALTLDDLQQARAEFKKQHLKTLKKLETEEIDEIMQGL
jgi:hypothetical protein